MSASHRIVESSEVFFAHDTTFGRLEDELIRPLEGLLARFGFKLTRFSDEVSTGSSYVEKIIEQIRRSAFVIADVGCRKARKGERIVTNANVAHEVGTAVTLGKFVLPLVAKGNEAKIASNLRVRDAVIFPGCFQVGSMELARLERTIADFATETLIAPPVRIFQHAGSEYYHVLQQITEFPGPVSYVGTTLRAFFRPIALDERWLREVRKVADEEVERELELRRSRRNAWLESIRDYPCIDLYQREALEKGLSSLQWRNMTLSKTEAQGFIDCALEAIESRNKYSIAIVAEPLNFKFWIKETPHRKLVVLESLNWENFTKPVVGGLVLAAEGVASPFQAEFDRLRGRAESGLDTNAAVSKWLKDLAVKVSKGAGR